MLLAVGGVLASPLPVRAHTTLRDYIQHRATVDVEGRNIDVTVELTFYEDCSVVERRRMDANGDGRIGEGEIRAYLKGEAERFERDLRLTFDGKPLELIPLFDPRIDLCGNDAVAPHFHVLKLEYFARTPRMADSGAVIELKDGLWADQPALRALETSGKDGIRATAAASKDPQVWRVKCRRPRGE